MTGRQVTRPRQRRSSSLGLTRIAPGKLVPCKFGTSQDAAVQYGKMCASAMYVAAPGTDIGLVGVER